MFRALPVIIAAISLSRPGISKPEVTTYARLLQREAKAGDFDPLTVVAMVHYESSWIPSRISADGEDYGLGQIRARFLRGCRTDADPLHAPSAACKAAKLRMLNGVTNLKTLAKLIGVHRAFCAKHHGKVIFEQWLASYQGGNHPSRKEWCVPGWKTSRVLSYRQYLINSFDPPHVRKITRGKWRPAQAALAKRRAPGKGTLAAKTGRTAAAKRATDPGERGPSAHARRGASLKRSASPGKRRPAPQKRPKRIAKRRHRRRGASARRR